MAKQIAMVDYTKCQPEKCDKGICLAVLACPNKILKAGPGLLPKVCLRAFW